MAVVQYSSFLGSSYPPRIHQQQLTNQTRPGSSCQLPQHSALRCLTSSIWAWM